MEDISFEEVYQSLDAIDKSVGVQSIIKSKYKPESVETDDLVDTTGVLNPYHQKKVDTVTEET